MAGALGVFARPESEVEAQCDQVGDLMGFGVGGDDRCAHDGVDNSEGGGLLSFEQRVLDAVVFKLTGEMPLSSPLWDWASGGLLESGRPSRRWVAAIVPHA